MHKRYGFLLLAGYWFIKNNQQHMQNQERKMHEDGSRKDLCGLYRFKYSGSMIKNKNPIFELDLKFDRKPKVTYMIYDCFQEVSLSSNHQREIKAAVKKWRMQSKPINSITVYRDWLYCASSMVEGSNIRVTTVF